MDVQLRGCIKSAPAERLCGVRGCACVRGRGGVPGPRSCPGTGCERWERGRQSRAHRHTGRAGSRRGMPLERMDLPREDAGGGVLRS